MFFSRFNPSVAKPVYALALLGAMGLAQAATFGSGCRFNTYVFAEGVESVTHSGTDCSGDLIERRGTMVDQVWNGEEYITQDFDQIGRTGASGSAGLGTLHAYSASFAQSTPMAKEFLYSNGDPGIIHNMHYAIGESNLSAYWFDEITVNPGSEYGRVILRFTVTMHGKTSVVETTQGLASFGARLIADDDRYPGSLDLSLSSAGTTSNLGSYWPGTKIRLYGELSAHSRAYAGRVYNWWHTPLGYIAESTSVADASNTAGFQIEVLTPGASYTSASGRSYVAMVPEPETYALAAAGLAVIGLGRLGRQRHTERNTSDTAA